MNSGEMLQVDKRYVLTDKLGQGGMGAVFISTDW